MDSQIDALLAQGRKRSFNEPVPKDLAPILKRMSERAETGDAVTVNVLREYVEKVTGIRRGPAILSRWVRDSGGKPWFRG